MSKKILGIVTVFAMIMVMSLSSFAISIGHGFTQSTGTEKCSVTVSGPDTYNTVVKAKVYNYNGVLKATDERHSTQLTGTLTATASNKSAIRGYWYAHTSSNQHSNVIVTQSGNDK